MKFASHPFFAIVICATALDVSTVRSAEAQVTFVVDSLLDEIDDDTGDGVCHTATNHCSVRAAIMQANHTATSDTIVIDIPAGIHALSIPQGGADTEESGDLNIMAPSDPAQHLWLKGANAETAIIDAGQIDRVISVDQGRTAMISGLTLRNGSDSLVTGFGGGVQNAGELTISRSVIEGNYSASAGGGIGNHASGTLHVDHSAIRSNATQFSGGGLISEGIATIDATTIDGNVAVGAGGGLYLVGGGVTTLSASTVSHNNANNGGGAYVDNSLIHPEEDTHLIVVESTFSTNFSYTNGGGIFSRANTAIYSTSIVDNDADHDRDMLGGIGGGVFVESGTPFVAVNALVADNTILDAPIYDDCNGTLAVYGQNLFGDPTGCTYTGNGTAATGAVALASIGNLQDNGGPTFTHALLPGSEAIDATTPQGCVDDNLVLLEVDQRGAQRVAGARCDVGAYESGATLDLIFRDGFD